MFDYYMFQNSQKQLMPSPKPKPLGSVFPIIPFHIYQTWHTKNDLMPCMQKAIARIQTMNPEFHHHLFDDKDCRKFMEEEMADIPGVLEAYDDLIPGAYKADLWRYCILYRRGGIYLDIKFTPCDGFKFMELVDNEYFVLDRADLIGRPAIYNALMVAKAGNTELKRCIEKLVDNVRNRNYGLCKLDITGPTMMASQFPYYQYCALGYLRFDGNEQDNYYIITGEGRKLLEFYREYRDEQRQTAKTGYYHELWNKRQVFRDVKN
jgi:mannosyltransferase OCH1-like enzyme